MDTLYSWEAIRSGATMTIKHSCGKVSGIKAIAPNENGQLVAVKGEQEYLLATPPYTTASYVSPGVSDLFFNYSDVEAAYAIDEDERRDVAMLTAAEDMRTMLRCAGIAPPTAAALIKDFHDRV